MRRPLVILWIGCAFLWALVAVEVAQAYDATSTPAAVQYDGIAHRYFNQSPNCPQGYRVLVEPITDQQSEVAGEAAMPGCWMRIEPRWWQDQLSENWWLDAAICAIYVHEYGHSLGLPHSTDPYSVMNPHTEYAEGMPRECRELETVPAEAARRAELTRETGAVVAEPAPQPHRRRHHHRHHRRMR